jgi:hypothetical protein
MSSSPKYTSSIRFDTFAAISAYLISRATLSGWLMLALLAFAGREWFGCLFDVVIGDCSQLL